MTLEKGEKETLVFQRFEEYLKIMPKEAFLEDITEENFISWIESNIEDEGLANDLKEIISFNEMNKLVLMEIIDNHLHSEEDASIEE